MNLYRHRVHYEYKRRKLLDRMSELRQDPALSPFARETRMAVTKNYTREAREIYKIAKMTL